MAALFQYCHGDRHGGRHHHHHHRRSNKLNIIERTVEARVCSRWVTRGKVTVSVFPSCELKEDFKTYPILLANSLSCSGTGILVGLFV
ncbi:hypothetical protein E2C01_040933 [Portunus trituberculatus]|uniref:Uncharacterized protein n=1 Tax=Portunus trituberculatus TaxID=210409 RepID=A0A5B7FP20_PORTR|nr:hypothetical protein [Portunus trituberculatus]